MRDASSFRVPIQVGALKRIDGLPVDFDQQLFGNYPAMKLGVTTAVDFYIADLLVLAKNMMQEQTQCCSWIITAPPFNTAPAAANLLCWKLYEALQQELSSDVSLSLLDLHLDVASMEIKNEQDFKRYYEYSSNSVEERVKERSLLHGESDDIRRHFDDFNGKGVLVVNDIKVTGTQQDFMNQSFDQVSPAAVKWLYILEIDKELGVANPQIEFQINNSKIQSLDEFRKILCADDTCYTARCITRLFTYEVAEFTSLLESLNSVQLELILRYAIGEGRFESGYFEDKFKLLEIICDEAITRKAEKNQNEPVAAASV